METNSAQAKQLGSVGGMGNSVSAGEFVAGPQIAAQGNARGFAGAGLYGNAQAGGDVRGGTATAGGYNQGAMVTGSLEAGGASENAGGTFGPGAVPDGGLKEGGDVRNGGAFGKTSSASKSDSGYNQGDMFAASKK